MQAHGSPARRVASRYARVPLLLGLAAVLALGLIAPAGVSSTVAPAPITVTQAVTSGPDDVNEDGTNFSAGGNTIWLGNGASATASYTGLRFTGVALPRGATVTSAHLEVVSSKTQWVGLSFSIAAEAADTSAPFSAASRPSQRVLTEQRLNHSSNLRWQSGVRYALDEMAPVVQEVVSRPGWRQGNSLSVILTGTGGSWGRKFVRSFESDAANAPRLVITYDAPAPADTATPTPTSVPPLSTASPTATPVPATATVISSPLPTSTPTPLPSLTPTSTLAATVTSTATVAATPTATSTGPTTLTRLIASGTDDVNEDGASFDSGATSIWLGTGGAGAGASYTGLRFTSVAVPQGATVLSAHLEVTASQTQWNTMDFALAAEAVDSSPPFSAASPPSQRQLTTSQASHSSDAQWVAGTTYSLDEMAPVIQEVVSRPGWQSGNSLSLILKGSGQPWSRKFVHSFDGSATRAPRLVITYSSGAPLSTATATPAATSTPPPSAATLGQWSAVKSWPLVAVHAALQPTGEVLVWDAWELGATPSARLWNPLTEAFVAVPNSLAAIFCAGQAVLGDGRLLVVGGHNGADIGIVDTTVFDPISRTWSRAASMAYARWYPTVLTLPDGRVLALSGNQTETLYATVPEVYDPATNTWAELTGADLLLPTYPQAHVAPDGRVFVAGSEGQAPRSRLLDLASQTWTTLGGAPSNGVTVMYAPGKVLMTGGGDPAVSQAFVIDLNQPSPTWRAVAPMAYARNFHNHTILPDGTVLVTGGGASASLVATSGGVLAAELWDPTTETFTTLASMQVPRLYHSIGLLLPDGRVLVAGGGRTAPAIDYPSAEIYSPPYLFRGPRPSLTSAPDHAAYGATITVQTPDAASITRVSLIRASAATHTLNTDQRYLSLAFTAVAGGLQVTMPASTPLAPPGSYLLFLLNREGVPSIGHFVTLNQSGAGLRAAESAPERPAGEQAPTAPARLTARWGAVQGVPAVELRWADRSGNEVGFLVERAADARFTREVVRFAVAANTPAYVDTTAPARRVSYYRVVAIGRSGAHSSPSNLVRLRPGPA